MQQNIYGKSLFEMLLESMKPQKTFYSPSVPSSFNVNAWQKYEEIFGDHDCNECEVKAVEDNETGNMINLKLCKNNFLNPADIMRYTNGVTS